jgi:hypothetical protein
MAFESMDVVDGRGGNVFPSLIVYLGRVISGGLELRAAF